MGMTEWPNVRGRRWSFRSTSLTNLVVGPAWILKCCISQDSLKEFRLVRQGRSRGDRTLPMKRLANVACEWSLTSARTYDQQVLFARRTVNTQRFISWWSDAGCVRPILSQIQADIDQFERQLFPEDDTLYSESV